MDYHKRMMRKSCSNPQQVRDEIALAAARSIAEEGLDYSSAKRKAARQITGSSHIAHDALPDNDQIEEKIREYQALFQSETQPQALRGLRTLTLYWMKRLAPFHPYLTGAVLNGTASKHSDIHLQVFCDNTKEVAVYLLDANIAYQVSETNHFNGHRSVETLSFLSRNGVGSEKVGIHITLYDTDDLRGAMRADSRGRLARADAAAVEALLAQPEPASSAIYTSSSAVTASNALEK